MIALCAVIALFVAAAAVYVRLRRLGDAPDELSHLAYLRLIRDHLELPINTAERQQPPLYYLLGAALFKLTGSVTVVHGLSIVLGALTLVTVALAARELWPDSPGLQVLAPAIIAANPEFQFLSGVISDDPLSFAAAGLMTFLIVRVIRRPPDRATYVAVGAAIGVGLMAKETDYYLAALLVLVSVTSRRGRATRWGILLVAAIPLVADGWWFARNLATYHSLLPTLHPITGAPEKLTHLEQVPEWVVGVFVSSFALFGTMSIPIAVAPYPVYLGLGLCTVGIGALGLRAVLRRWPSWNRQERLMALTVAAIPAVALCQMVANSVLIDFQAQGRYLFVAFPAVALMVCLAVRHGIPCLSRRVATTLVFVVVVLAAVVDGLGFQSVALSGSTDRGIASSPSPAGEPEAALRG